MIGVRTTLPFGLLLAAATALAGQEPHAHPAEGTEKLGSVVFPASCRAAVQPRFERGVAMLHSFWFSESERAFQEVAQEDPGCAMAHRGVALSRRGNPFAGAPAAEKAASLADRATPRERDYIDTHGPRGRRAARSAGRAPLPHLALNAGWLDLPRNRA